jgi:8-oxo-dGTP pyrophosphatase MutT (NUDIX family)
MTETTWDGKPIHKEPPFGATVVVYRRVLDQAEFLILHRAHGGPAYEGDWAWTPPAGARQPGESIAACAARELQEETGLVLPIVQTSHGSGEWFVYCSELAEDVDVVLDAEHDQYLWLNAGEAARRCQPQGVAAALIGVARDLRVM